MTLNSLSAESYKTNGYYTKLEGLVNALNFSNSQVAAVYIDKDKNLFGHHNYSKAML